MAANVWKEVYKLPGSILGYGQEGIVRLFDNTVYKHFYPEILSADKVSWFKNKLSHDGVTPAAEFRYNESQNTWVAEYPNQSTQAFEIADESAVRNFLSECLRQELVCANIKRSNFRIREDGSLWYIDIGNCVMPMDVSYFRDSACRLFSIGLNGSSDEELQRRKVDTHMERLWDTDRKFADFYGSVVSKSIIATWDTAPTLNIPLTKSYSDVSLLLKACAMDVRDLELQVVHLIDQLSTPCKYYRKYLLIDPFEGPFLRQHNCGDLKSVYAIAERLVAKGYIDEILVSPTVSEKVTSLNRRWFSVETCNTHSIDGVPVAPQIWAFEQIKTRYVLQADVDVLVGRQDFNHDFLEDMITAISAEKVTCVAFNIPKTRGFVNYDAPDGEYKPEVRLGLLDLARIKQQLPLAAGLIDGKLDTTWYRALHEKQKTGGLRTLRGGDSRTFYIHPLNDIKKDFDKLNKVRDLVSQGIYPDEQIGCWDVCDANVTWRYQLRSEKIVVFALGRNTSAEKVTRFSAGLRIQNDQTFGVVVIDDSSDEQLPGLLQKSLSWLGSRCTLVRNATRKHRVYNYRHGITQLCTNPETMIIIVDLDDALAHPGVVMEVGGLGAKGHDVVLAAPFRPDAPLKIYIPKFTAVRENYGGDVWIHLRAFRKRLFDSLEDELLMKDGEWINEQLDYAMMIPIVERANKPIYLPFYRYWHERTTVLDQFGEKQRDQSILHIVKNTREENS